MSTMINEWHRRLPPRVASFVTTAIARYKASVSLDDSSMQTDIHMPATEMAQMMFDILDKVHASHSLQSEVMLKKLAQQQAMIDAVEFKEKKALADQLDGMTQRVKKLESAGSITEQVLALMLKNNGEAE